MIKPEVLNIYVRLCETLSFTKTAEVLNIPRSTVSDAIKKLEEDLAVVLFKRTTRKVLVTEEGSILYEKALAILSDLADIESTFGQKKPETIRGRVRVDMPTALAKNLILPKLSSFTDRYPDIKVELGCSDRVVDIVGEGFDFVIRAGKLKDSSLIARRVGAHKIVNCVGHRYAEKYGIPKSLDSLKNHYQVHYLQNFGVGRDGFEYSEGGRSRFVKTNSLITVNNSISYHEACLAGLGIIQIPEVGVLPYLKSGEMIQVLKKFQMEPMNVYLVYTNRERIPERVKVFMDWCEENLRYYIITTQDYYTDR